MSDGVLAGNRQPGAEISRMSASTCWPNRVGGRLIVIDVPAVRALRSFADMMNDDAYLACPG